MSRPERRDAALALLENATPPASADLFDAYICAGQYDKAAKLLVAMLQMPDTRTSAILTAQIYADPVKAGTDLSELRYRMRAVVAGDPVQNAMKTYARTLGLPFTMAISH